MSLFDEAKACDIATFFLSKSSGHMSMIKLMKLMYLSERESLKQLHFPMLGDRLVCMDNGPVLSNTYDLMKQKGKYHLWSDRISAKDGKHNLYLLKPINDTNDLLELSRNDLKILSLIWENFGQYTHSQLIEYTHSEACPEWTHPNGSSTSINYEDILLSFGIEVDTINEIVQHIEEEKLLRAC